MSDAAGGGPGAGGAPAGSPNSLFDLTGRVALVTGGSRGLGQAMVRGLAAAGADVVIASRKFDACAELAAKIEADTGRRALPYACHVAHWEELEPLVDAVYREFGRLDVLVNNAGMSPLYDRITDVSEKMWDTVLGINLKGPFRLSALAGTRMAADGGGSIINISSVGSIHPSPTTVPYSAAKAGLNAMTIALAHTFGPTVRVNCVMPGAFRTDVTKVWSDATFERVDATTALGRIGEPGEIVGAVLYLASEASSYTTGAVFPVDGGTPT